MKNLASIRGFKNASIGTIMSWTGTNTDIPTGWLSCDGTTYDDDDYPALVSVIGYTYGGSSGSSTFVVPNLNGSSRVPVHKGASYDAATGGSSNTSITLNASWLIEDRPNRQVSFSAPASIQSNGPSGSIWQQSIGVQPRVMSHDNLPSHNHTYTIQTMNNQFTGNPSAESGGDVSVQFAGNMQDKPLVSPPGAPMGQTVGRYGVPSGAHSHGAATFTVQRGSIQIAPYVRDYDDVNSTVALNNNPGVGNAQLAMNTPYQTAIYIIKAF